MSSEVHTDPETGESRTVDVEEEVAAVDETPSLMIDGPHELMALEEMARWRAKGGARFVNVSPEVVSFSLPQPTDIVTRTSKGEGLFWTVEVGIERGDESPFSFAGEARTIAEAWKLARTRMLDVVL